MKQDSGDTDAIDACFRALTNCATKPSPIIACLYTGKVPNHCAPMPRNPQPPVGQPIDKGLPETLAQAVELNDAIHDGALMIGRARAGEPYRITGWSFRLLPPDGATQPTVNRGSAFHSSLSMSQVKGVDRVYLASKGSLLRFQAGRWYVVA